MKDKIVYETTDKSNKSGTELGNDITDTNDNVEDDIFVIGDNVRLVKPKDKRLERLLNRRSQFSSSSSYSEGSVEGETGI